MGLPAGIEKRSREAWLELANNSDAAKRKVVTDALRALGKSSTDYMPWDAATRVQHIMDAQGADEGGGAKASSAKDKVDSSEGTKSSGGGGGVDAATKKAIAELDARTRKIHDLLVVLVLSTPSAKANAEEMEIKLELLGNG